MPAERLLEHVTGLGVVLAQQEQIPPTLEGLCFAGAVVRAVIHLLRLRVRPVRIGGHIEQHRQVPARECEPSAQSGISVARLLDRCLGALQLAERAWEVAGRRAHVGGIATHARDLGRGARDLVDSQRCQERGGGARVVTPSQTQEPDIVPRLGGADAIVRGAVGDQGLVITSGGGGVVARGRPEVAEVDEVHRFPRLFSSAASPRASPERLRIAPART